MVLDEQVFFVLSCFVFIPETLTPCQEVERLFC